MRMNWTQENLDVGMNNLIQMDQAAEVNDLDIQVTHNLSDDSSHMTMSHDLILNSAVHGACKNRIGFTRNGFCVTCSSKR